MTRGQIVTASSAAIAIAAVIALVVVTRNEERRSPAPAPAPMITANAASATTITLPATTVATLASAKVVTTAPIADAGEDTFDPIADDSWKLLKPGDPPQPGDSFEDPDTKVQRAKLLSRVGVIRVGYANKDSVVKDEAAVTTILRRAALEIDRLDRDRQDPPYKRFPEYEAVLAKYRDELRPHMTGTVMVGGLGWTLGVKVPP